MAEILIGVAKHFYIRIQELRSSVAIPLVGAHAGDLRGKGVVVADGTLDINQADGQVGATVFPRVLCDADIRPDIVFRKLEDVAVCGNSSCIRVFKTAQMCIRDRSAPAWTTWPGNAAGTPNI